MLPGEKEELHLHPAASSLVWPRNMALGFALWGAILWWTFHAAWWTAHQPSDWTAPWTWLWGNRGATYLWTGAGLLVGGALSSLPRGPWTRLWVAASATAVVLLVAFIRFAHIPAFALPVLTAAATIPALSWLEVRRLSTHYHITNLRIVVRTTFPRRSERSVLHTSLIDLDARLDPFPDTGTLFPVTAGDLPDAAAAGTHGLPPAGKGKARKQAVAAEQKASQAGEARTESAAPMRLTGVHPLRRVRRLVELLAQQATSSEGTRLAQGLDRELAQARAALQRR